MQVFYIIGKHLIRAFQQYAKHPISPYHCRDMKHRKSLCHCHFYSINFILTNAIEVSTTNHIPNRGLDSARDIPTEG